LNEIYTKFDFHSTKFNEERYANYDNLSYLIADNISARYKTRQIASCKDYFATKIGLLCKSLSMGFVCLLALFY